MKKNARRFVAFLLPWFLATGASAQPHPKVAPPGEAFAPPGHPGADGVPLVFEHSRTAGPDQTFLLVGASFSGNLTAWGPSASHAGGQEWKPSVLLHKGAYLAAALPQEVPDGVFVVWARNDRGHSRPIVLNRPEPWWCGPDVVSPGDTARVFGNNLARRPDQARAFVYVCTPGQPGVWAVVTESSAYAVRFKIPRSLTPGTYEAWVHAGNGGDWGWGGPLALQVTAKKPAPEPPLRLAVGVDSTRLRDAIKTVSRQGGGEIRLPGGTIPFSGTLEIPARVTLAGEDPSRTTILQLVTDRTARFSRMGGAGWGQAPGRIHSVGDRMIYRLDVPKAGTWNVWVRYGTDMKPFNQPGVSGNHALSIDDGAPVPLENLPNTGTWASTTWAKAAALPLTAGRHTLTWSNVKGGGISLDAFVFTLDRAFQPGMTPPPVSGPDRIVLQAEDCDRFLTKEGELPGGDRAAVWLSGDGAGLKNLTILGTAEVNLGVAVRAPAPTAWVSDVVVENVKVADIDGKQAENCAVSAHNALRCRIANCELWGRTPLFLSGARKSEFASNTLVSQTRFGGNSEAAILGRTEPIEECVVEHNRVLAPTSALAGGPTARRLLWFSTGHGSVTHNAILGNGASPRPGDRPRLDEGRFGGVAGTDQNVGEMILFEGNHRTAYFGPLAGADVGSVTLPKTLPATPDNRLGSVQRAELAHDAAGNETPFWPPDADDGSEEPPIGEYYVTVFAGQGQGQTRRIIKRTGETLVLDKPWAVPPKAGSLVAVGIAFYQNLIIGNNTPDGMTGIQLWISCVENVVAGNHIARQRKPGLFLYANGTTLASSMPRTWNRGISPLFWNTVEGNRSEECSAGALVTSGDEGPLPIDFPRALGNVLRHNTFARNRTDGVIVTSRPTPSGVKDASASVVGTVVEFNVVRDAQIGYHAAASTDVTVFRRNHAYFWYPVSHSSERPAAFQVDLLDSSVVLERNSIEGIHGGPDGSMIVLKTPAGQRHLPEDQRVVLP